MSVLQIPNDLLELRSAIGSFIDSEIRPVEHRYEHEIRETGGMAAVVDEKRRIRRKSAALGYYTLAMPVELGGGGLSYLGQVLLHEEIARSGLILANRGGVLPSVEGPSPILADCTPDQRQRFLDPLMRAEKETCFALTEPHTGSDATAIHTRAEKHDGMWRLNGRKHFVTHGDHADFALVFAVTDPEKRARGGITAFFVEKGTPGFNVGRVQQTASPVNRPVELVFEDVLVPVENVLGRVGYGFYAAMRWINGSRLSIAAWGIGIAGHLMDRMLEHAAHDGSRTDQSIQGLVVDSWCELEAARSMLYEMASRIDDGADGRREAAGAKLTATELAGRVADRAIQVFGQSGFATEMGIERFWREVRTMRLYEGTSEILRNNVAKTLGL